MEIISVEDIHYDYTLLSAQLELTKADPTYIMGPGNFPSALPLFHTKSTHVPRSPFHALRDGDAVGSVEQVQHCHVYCAYFGRGHDRTLCSSHRSVLKAIQTPEQYPV